MYNIAVTGLNAGDSPAPGIPVIRCLKEHPDWDGHITGLAYDALESGIMDDKMVDTAYLMPYPKSGKEILLDRITYIHEKEKLDVIIPTLDSEILNYISIQDELSDLRIKLFLPTEEQFNRRSKVNLKKLLQDTGVLTPKTSIVSDPSKFVLHKEDLPVMVKGIFYEAYLAHTVDEAFQYIYKIADKWGYPVLVQEVIEGEEFNAAAVGNGKLVGVACMKKLVLTDKGKGWACVSIKNEQLLELSEKIVNALKWRGALEIEAIYSKKDEQFYLIEVNPRFPAWIYLAKASGINLPYTYLQLALGKDIQQESNYKSGVVFTNYTTNLITELSKIESLFTNGEISYEKAL